MNDWKDALASIQALGNLPEGPEDQPKETGDDIKKKLPELHISMEKKGRAGKTATIIYGFDSDDDAATIAKTLKQRLGTGGSSRGGEILIQGDRRQDVTKILRDLGYKVK